jgi:hypothetical protein
LKNSDLGLWIKHEFSTLGTPKNRPNVDDFRREVDATSSISDSIKRGDLYHDLSLYYDMVAYLAEFKSDEEAEMYEREAWDNLRLILKERRAVLKALKSLME